VSYCQSFEKVWCCVVDALAPTDPTASTTTAANAATGPHISLDRLISHLPSPQQIPALQRFTAGGLIIRTSLHSFNAAAVRTSAERGISGLGSRVEMGS
jgi:hypothetical protein